MNYLSIIAEKEAHIAELQEQLEIYKLYIKLLENKCSEQQQPMGKVINISNRINPRKII